MRQKRYCTIVLAILFCIDHSFSQTPSTNISFDERIHDFGTILEKDGKVTHTFVFHNNGKTPVVINDIYSDCGCIGKIVTNSPVKPGEKGKVTITFNPDYKSGFFSKEIVVYSNNRQSYNRIWVQGNVKPAEHPIEDDYPYNFGEGLYLRLKVMAFGYVAPGETKQMELNYANSTNKEMTVNFMVQGKKDGLRFTNPIKIGPKGRGVVNFTYTMPHLSKDDALIYIIPYVNNKKVKDTLEIKVLNANDLHRK